MNKRIHILILLVIALLPAGSMFGLQKRIDALKKQAASAVGSRKEQLNRAIAQLEGQRSAEQPARAEEPRKPVVVPPPLPAREEEEEEQQQEERREDRQGEIRRLVKDIKGLLEQIRTSSDEVADDLARALR